MAAWVRITDGHVDALRAYLTQDLSEALRRNRELRDSGDLSGYAALIAAALVVAIRRRFSSTSGRADVVQFVADLRKKKADQEDFDPLTAEILVLRALGVEENSPLDENEWVRAQVLLLDALVQESQLGPIAIDRLLGEARTFAPRWYG